MVLISIVGCQKQVTTKIIGSGSADPISLTCTDGTPGNCKTIWYITQSSSTPSGSDPNFQLGIYDAFSAGTGVTLKCETAATSDECLQDAREYLIAACDNEVDAQPPIYSRKYTNSTNGFIHVELDGMVLNLAFTEIICQLNQSRIN